ncbi:hypothetical protein OTB20_40610 [Streptomyces sp. H27-H1]|uniref:hypothetical protein n=1 Tax=Streptomyces sp. H27-H1 TaxID=2996461 RepID=UPI002271E121|nr:hypothetical protein [Streptomyces sp. H27-H1]MCY0932346.1 hypothetical protein [Streptomyces sp. H27-H1]
MNKNEEYTLNAEDALAKGTHLMAEGVRTRVTTLIDQGRGTIEAAAVWAQLAATAHLMAAGTTGSGKGAFPLVDEDEGDGFEMEMVDLSGKRGGPVDPIR